MDDPLPRRPSQQSGCLDNESLFSENEDPNRIVTRSPKSRFKLGYLAVMGLLKYVYRKPAYRPDTFLFVASLFGISFIILGNMAGNAISFGIRILEASNTEVTNGAVRGIAIAASVVACFIHTFSRKGGILLSSLFAIIKICLMLFIIVTAICYGTGTFKDIPGSSIDRHKTFSQNLSPSNAFSESSSSANGYAQAFLAIIFAFGGFEQPNYVLGEIARPHRTYAIAMTASVSIVCVLYMAVNISYMVVVPKELQVEGASVAESFFQLTYGALSPDDNTGARVFSAFLAISSLGNIIVMTYTAARVKQEIAKEGLLPWPKFFGQNNDLSFGRFLRWAQRTESINKQFGRLLRLRWLAPENHWEPTPVGALVLHMLTCLILLLATYGESPQNAYLILTGVAAYVVNACFGSLLAAGILYLRFSERQSWRQKANNVHPWLSVTAATIYLVGNLFPIITSWVKPEKSLGTAVDTISVTDTNANLSTDRGTSKSLSWFIVPTIGWAVLGFAALWWLGRIFMVRIRERRTHTQFTIQKEVELDEDPVGSGAYVQVHETVYLSWKGREILRDMTMQGHQGVSGMTESFAGHSTMSGAFGGPSSFAGGGGAGMNGINGHTNDYYGRYP
ncbi:hypothetical protein H2200_007430 [Cladophialophora chaetospira]|uniref:High-affinity methionine permease n=1 Tax=Cladophialophora chaetospira TaxID=386627 RepID=A0AA39CHI2_9EURO|nr:hypothetical protein H2200_007430 [Cladophialophora chaetospira]